MSGIKYNKILEHPMKEEIIECLNNGESVRSLSHRISSKYRNKNLHISSVTLQAFRKEFLNLDGEVLKKIQEAEKFDHRKIEEVERKKQIEQSSAYNKKINEIVDTKLDVARKILELDKVIDSRIEYWYNEIQEGRADPAKGDKELRQFIDRQIVLLEKYKKFVEGFADKTIDCNININVMNEQIGIIQEVIRDCIAMFSPEQATYFMDVLHKRISGATYRQKELEPHTQITIEELNEL